MNGTAQIKGNKFGTNSSYPYNNIVGGAVYSIGTFTMAGSAEITGTNGTVSNTYVYGVCVYASGASSHFTMQDNAKISDNQVTTYDGNTNLMGGGVCNIAGSQFTMQGNAEISGNQLTASSGYCYGAGVYNQSTGSLFTMKDNAKISNNSETSAGINCGGGVYNYSSAQINMQGGTISGNTVYSTSKDCIGGGVYSYNNTIFTMSGGTITGNSTNSSTAGKYSRGGGVFSSNATFTMSGGTISANQANNSAGYSEGGGVFNWNIMNMTGGIITGNTAKNGGGVCNYTTFTMSGDALITSNTATVEGGGVENSTGTFTMSSGTISGNTAPKGSGVLNAAAFNLSGSAVLDADNDVYLNSDKEINVTAELTGTAPFAIITPAAYATGTTVVTLDAALTAGDYTSKFAVTPSGAAWGLAANGQNLQLLQEDVFLNGETGDDANNGATKATAVKTFDKAKSLLGPNGTIYICGTVTVYGGDAFDWSLSEGQTMKRYEDAIDPANDFKDIMISLSPTAYLTLSNIIIDGGWDNALGTGVQATSPIIKLQSSSHLTLSTGAEIRNNNLVFPTSVGFSVGSGIAGSGYVTINGGKITGNTIRVHAGDFVTAHGAGIGLTECTLTMISGEISGNEIYSAHASGGGVYIGEMSTFTMSGGTICNNGVYLSGDEVFVAGGGGVSVEEMSSFTMSGGTICGNDVDSNESEALGAGGGVFIDFNSSFSMQRGTIGGSSAGDANKAYMGGGIYCYNSLTMSGGDIAGNDAELGGGVVFAGFTFSMSGGTIQNNHATVMGGGLALGQGVFDMHGDASISGNSADNNGDGVYYASGGFNMSGAAFIAQNNPVYVASDKDITITGTLDTHPAVWVVPENYPTGKNIVTVATANYTDGTGATILPAIALADEDAGYELQTSGMNVNITAPPIEITLSTAGTDYTGSAITYSGSVTKPDDVLISDLTFWYKVFGSDDSTYTTTKPINAGTYSVKATLTDSELYWDTESNVVTFTINTINPTLSAFGDQQADYTGSDFAIVPPTVTGAGDSDISGDGTITYLYKLSSSTDDLVEGLPRDAGIYTVTATYSDNPNYNTDFITSTITINKAALTATANNASRPYGAVNPSLTITYSGFVGGEDEDVIDTLPNAATTATITSNAGTYPITVSGGSAENYSLIYVPGTLTVNMATPDIVFEDQSGSYSGKAFAITAPSITGVGNIDLSGNGTLSYSYMAHTSGVEWIDGLPKDAGVYDVKATFTGDENCTGGYDVNVVTISKQLLTVTANNNTKIYGAENPVLTIAYSGFVNGEDASNLSTLPTASTTATITSNVGTYPITVSGGSAENYSLIYVPGTLTVNMATPDIVFEDQSGSYSGKAFAITAPSITGAGNIDLSGNGTLSYSYMAHTSGVEWIDGLPKDAGVYDVKATFTGDANCAGGYDVNVVTINKQLLTVTANNKTKVYGAGNPALTVAYSGFVNGEDASNLSTLPIASTTATALSVVGTYPITVSGGSATNYSFAYSPGTLTVDMATPDIAFEDQSGSYSGKAFAITAPSITGVGNIDLSGNGTLSYSYMAHTSGVEWIDGLPKDAGVYDVKATFTGDANCAGGYDVNVVTINKQLLTVTANSKTKIYGAENPVLTFAYSGFVNGEDASNLTTLPTASTTATALSAVGAYPITVSGGGAVNYTLIYVPGTLTVSEAVSEPSSTPAPAATPTATPAATPTATPAPSAAPTPTQSLAPTSTPQPSAAMGATITPSTIELDKAAGTVTIEIDVADLPEGTTAIQMPSGDVIYLDGSDTVKLEIKEEELDENGRLNIVTLDNEEIPTGSFEIQIEDADGRAIVPETGSGFTGIISTLLWIVIGIAGVGAAAFIIIIIFRKNKRD